MYVSIDIETTGLDYNKCQILEIGVIIDNGEPLSKLPELRMVIDNEIISGEPCGLSMNSRLIRAIADGKEELFYPEDVACILNSFLTTHGVPNGFTIAGANFGNFDSKFLEKLPDWKSSIKSNHRYIDVGNLYWEPEIDGFYLPSMFQCLKRAKINKPVSHKAIDDAKDVIRLVRAYVNKNRSN